MSQNTSSAVVVSLDAEKASRYILGGLIGFLGDPPDSDYQRGFLGALLIIYKEGLGKGVGDDRLALPERMCEP